MDQNTLIAVISTVIALLATATSLVSARAALRAASASERSALAVERSEHRARQPRLSVHPVGPVASNATIAMYHIRNDGPEPLDQVIVFRPVTGDGIRYDVGSTEADFVDETPLGPLALGEQKLVKLSVGPAIELPEFRVVARAYVNDEHWDTLTVLPSPRI
ncbi:hypothetical protein [Arthrobacter bambusae]|uniref:hypothetical protein n=1 Tax=Arthrobacter bambusae TaxID=1338426 RepID=UPI00278ACC11|nr:hypothetical protein [Arthrobacter bambusae]MDQ0241456.1 hypothetical protein [Arthrobacter bambusae]